MTELNNASFSPEVESAEEWQQKWEEFIQLARQYDWPEDYLEAFLQARPQGVVSGTIEILGEGTRALGKRPI